MQPVNIDYQPASGGVIYNEMANVLDYNRDGEDKLTKYKGFLNSMQTYKTYG